MCVVLRVAMLCYVHFEIWCLWCDMYRKIHVHCKSYISVDGNPSFHNLRRGLLVKLAPVFRCNGLVSKTRRTCPKNLARGSDTHPIQTRFLQNMAWLQLSIQVIKGAWMRIFPLTWHKHERVENGVLVVHSAKVWIGGRWCVRLRKLHFVRQHTSKIKKMV